MLALFSINFTPLWDQASKSLSVVAALHPPSFWRVFMDIYSKLCFESVISETEANDGSGSFYEDCSFGTDRIIEWNLCYGKVHSKNHLFFSQVITPVYMTIRRSA